MDLLKLIQEKLKELQTDEEGAKFLKLSKATLAKARTGTASFPLSAGQAIIDDLLKKKRIMLVGPGKGNMTLVSEAPPAAATAPPAASVPPTAPIPPEAPEGALTAPGAPSDDPAERHRIAGLTVNGLVDEVLARVGDLSPDDNRAIVDACLGKIKSNVRVCISAYPGADIPPIINLSLMAQTRGFKVAGLMIERQRNLDDARNLLLDGFLATGAEWGFFLDPDIVPPFGNPEWFKKNTGAGYPPEILGIKALERMTKGDEKLVVGACFRVAGPTTKLEAQPFLEPRGQEDAALETVVAERGPQNKYVEVDWLSSACFAIHRRVLEAIKKRNQVTLPEGKPYPFFSTVVGDRYGADRNFGKLVKSVNHRMFLDLAVRCARGHRSLSV